MSPAQCIEWKEFADVGACAWRSRKQTADAVSRPCCDFPTAFILPTPEVQSRTPAYRLLYTVAPSRLISATTGKRFLSIIDIGNAMLNITRFGGKNCYDKAGYCGLCRSSSLNRVTQVIS
jgi:hypothetical protein